VCDMVLQMLLVEVVTMCDVKRLVGHGDTK